MQLKHTPMRKLQNEELTRLTRDEFKSRPKTPLIVVLDNVRSLNNIGSVFRTADAFLLEGIYLCEITAVPPHKDIHKTALGATESVDWKYFESTLEAITQLKENGYCIASIEQAEKSVTLDKFQATDYPAPYALVFGHEIRGVQQSVVDLSDVVIEIPQYGTKHSFNIAVSAGIVLWDFYQKIKG